MGDAKFKTFLVVYAALVLLYMFYKSQHKMERFEDGNEENGEEDANLGYLTFLASLNEQTPDNHELQSIPTDFPNEEGTYYTGLTKSIPEDSKSRECAIYYTNQRDTCKQYEKWYNLPMDALTARANDTRLSAENKLAVQTVIRDKTDDATCRKYPSFKSRSQAELQRIAGDTRKSAEERNAATLALQGRCANLLPNGNVCRINLAKDGWIEPQTSPDGQNTIPIKNVTDTSTMDKYGDPLNWGYCYKDLNGGSVDNAVMGVADNRGFLYNKDPVAPLPGSGKSFAELRFSSFAFDDYASMRDVSTSQYASHIGKSFCQMKRAPPPGIPDICMKCTLADVVDPGKYVLQNLQYVRLNNSTLQFMEVPPDQAMLEVLYRKVWSAGRRSLMLMPRTLSGQVIIVYYDACGRVDTLDTLPVAFSLKDIADIDTTVVAQSSSTLTDGEYSAVVARVAKYNGEIAKQESLMNQYNDPSTQPSYKAGLIMDEYVPRPGQSVPLASSEAEMRTIKGSLTRKEGTLPTVSGNPGFSQTRTSTSTGTSAVNRYYEWTGYLRVTVDGQYDFNVQVNGNTQVDVIVNNTLVAYRYNGRSATSLGNGMRLLPGYYNMTVRAVAPSGSDASVNVYWNEGNTKNPFKYIPSTAYFYNYNRVLYDKAKYTRDRLLEDRNIIISYINLVDAEVQKQVQATLTNAKKNFNLQQTIVSRGGSAGNALKADLKYFLGSKFDAKYLSGVNANVPNERNVFINFIAVNGVYNEIQTTFTDDGRILIERALDNINGKTIERSLPSGINFLAPQFTPVNYTLAFAVYIERNENTWRSIFHLGANDGDRIPGLWSHIDGSGRIHYRHASTRDWNDGVDTRTVMVPGQWNVFVSTMSDKTLTIYMGTTLNNLQKEIITLQGANRFTWNPNGDISRRKVTFNLYRNGSSTMNLKNVFWYNNALSENDVRALIPELLV